MSYTYEKIDKSNSKPPYYMLKVKEDIPLFDEVHITFPTGEESFKSVKESAWKYPHVTFCWTSNGTARKLHAYIMQKKNGKYGAFTAEGSPMKFNWSSLGTIFLKVVSDKKISDALWDCAF